MTEMLTPDEEAAAARATEQARLRKARREAKIKAGAENRLNKITGLGGGVQRAPPPAPAPSATTTTTTTTTPSNAPPSPAAAAAQPQHADPEEVDISEHFYQPKTTPRVPPATTGSNAISDAQLRQMMLGLDQPSTGTPPPGMPGMPPGMEDDPMMRMMMQMLGGAGASSTNNPFGGATPSFPPQQQQQPGTPLPNRYASLWRLLHALIALALGFYIALWTPFTGTKLSRDRAAAAAAGSAEERARLASSLADSGAGDVTRNFFWAFATAEALLLSTRHLFLDHGRSSLDSVGGGAGSGGIVALLAGFLPADLKAKVELAMRYVEVLGTVRRDLLVCVFVLGIAAWVRG
ncbi:hypothetical protein C7999DRAFT_43920 [Corynascus novoguineensis]|uniref:Uncharacterized protein n=1 Tax=Corynascus novoguineensis TaxID=1126955 RepID=A0AAN7HC75_9PEZI|nr:hypothetical protein C7999DRAFT_43920 [Corynascus novoguineensis]